VFAKRRVVIFVHGCFWHRHHCPLFKWPTTRKDFWRRKIDGNAKRDRTVQAALVRGKWRVLVVWECALKGPQRRPVEAVVEEIVRWVETDRPAGVVRGSRA
jgi:DNA mismatch endonuclease (patch repair protein)